MSDKRIAESFARGVEGMFSNDANWSIFDIPGAKEFYKHFGIEPDKDALEVECPRCGESGYFDSDECTYCAHMEGRL